MYKKIMILVSSMLVLSAIAVLVKCCFRRRMVEPTIIMNGNVAQQKDIKIILGTTRTGRTSKKIADTLKKMADKRTDIHTEIIDLNDYNLPFFNDVIAPDRRETITDPVVQKWSDKITQSSSFIIVLPEYNSGYPGVLKNALDSLYKEWNNKPVAFVGYSGGPTGGSSAIAQLRQVAKTLQMIPIDVEINIPMAWKVFDQDGNLLDKNIEPQLNNMIDAIIAAQKTKQETTSPR
jgi:NAD(P)H-dependent FMN reductase